MEYKQDQVKEEVCLQSNFNLRPVIIIVCVDVHDLLTCCTFLCWSAWVVGVECVTEVCVR